MKKSAGKPASPIAGLQKMLDKLQPKPTVVPQDLENQTLSKNPLERARQLDQQAQDQERRLTNS